MVPEILKVGNRITEFPTTLGFLSCVRGDYTLFHLLDGVDGTSILS